MGWKIYTWIYILLTVIGLFAWLEYSPLGLYELVSFMLTMILIAALIAHVYKTKIFDTKKWNILFIVTLILLIEDLIEIFFLPEGFVAQYLPFMTSRVPVTNADGLFGWLISIPAIYALYILSRPQGKAKKTIKKKK